MDNDTNIILEQYRIYTESKDKFIDRSFQTNRHYFFGNMRFVHSFSTI